MHAYDGWVDGSAHCTCGRTFDSVQELERHITAHDAATMSEVGQ